MIILSYLKMAELGRLFVSLDQMLHCKDLVDQHPKLVGPGFAAR
jgi:hypothetical protein